MPNSPLLLLLLLRAYAHEHPATKGGVVTQDVGDATLALPPSPHRLNWLRYQPIPEAAAARSILFSAPRRTPSLPIPLLALESSACCCVHAKAYGRSA